MLYFAQTNKTHNDMNAASTIQEQETQFDTVTLSIPREDLAFFKALVKRLGWKINKITSSEPKTSPRGKLQAS